MRCERSGDDFTPGACCHARPRARAQKTRSLRFSSRRCWPPPAQLRKRTHPGCGSAPPIPTSRGPKRHIARSRCCCSMSKRCTGIRRWDSQLARALQKLEEVSADESRDVRLRFDFGGWRRSFPETRSARSRYSRARSAKLRSTPRPSQAFFSLAICYAKLGRAEDELTAYDEYLRRETGVLNRANALSNRAEGQMLLGRLAPAVADYRASLSLQPDNALAHWGSPSRSIVAATFPGPSPKHAPRSPTIRSINNWGAPTCSSCPRTTATGTRGSARWRGASRSTMRPPRFCGGIPRSAKWKEYLAFASSDDRGSLSPKRTELVSAN